ncbi:putative ABC transporter solute-binding lipoprotein [Streptomyces sp. Tu6071]|nr:putative ABC transporter solute-binding lipoprotein [Streptomyces sp. Tu6071]
MRARWWSAPLLAAPALRPSLAPCPVSYGASPARRPRCSGPRSGGTAGLLRELQAAVRDRLLALGLAVAEHLGVVAARGHLRRGDLLLHGSPGPAGHDGVGGPAGERVDVLTAEVGAVELLRRDGAHFLVGGQRAAGGLQRGEAGLHRLRVGRDPLDELGRLFGVAAALGHDVGGPAVHAGDRLPAPGRQRGDAPLALAVGVADGEVARAPGGADDGGDPAGGALLGLALAPQWRLRGEAVLQQVVPVGGDLLRRGAVDVQLPGIAPRAVPAGARLPGEAGEECGVAAAEVGDRHLRVGLVDLLGRGPVLVPGARHVDAELLEEVLAVVELQWRHVEGDRPGLAAEVDKGLHSLRELLVDEFAGGRAEVLQVALARVLGQRRVVHGRDVGGVAALHRVGQLGDALGSRGHQREADLDAGVRLVEGVDGLLGARGRRPEGESDGLAVGRAGRVRAAAARGGEQGQRGGGRGEGDAGRAGVTRHGSAPGDLELREMRRTGHIILRVIDHVKS